MSAVTGVALILIAIARMATFVGRATTTGAAVSGVVAIASMAPVPTPAIGMAGVPTQTVIEAHKASMFVVLVPLIIPTLAIGMAGARTQTVIEAHKASMSVALAHRTRGFGAS